MMWRVCRVRIPQRRKPTGLRENAIQNKWHCAWWRATSQIVQYSIDMVNWNDIIVPATGSGAVTVTPGSPFDHVVVAIPALASKAFARLEASQ
jgi:hypothetical protein